MADVEGDLQQQQPEVEPAGRNQVVGGGGGGGIWNIMVDGEDDLNHHQEDLEPSIFLDDFPPLPDFSCMSSSSSTASTPAPAKPIASSPSSSSAASWAFMKTDDQQEIKKDVVHADAEQGVVVAGDIDGICDMDYMDLLDSNEIWDPSSIFQMEAGDQEIKEMVVVKEKAPAPAEEVEDDGSEELGIIFFEWLRANREHISVADMRNIKLRKSTIESASRRLGSSKQGRIQLLKLILEWVQQFQLNKHKPTVINDVVPVPPCFSPPPTWTSPQPQQQQPYHHQHQVMQPQQQQQQPYPVSPVMIGGYMGQGMDPYANNNNNTINYPQMWTAPPQLQLQPAIGGGFTAAAGYTYPANYYQGLNGEKMVRPGPSATKEARQKRMARQRKSSSYQSRHNRNHQIMTSQNQNDQKMQGRNPNGNIHPHANWIFWAKLGSQPLPVPPPGEDPVVIPAMAANEHDLLQGSTSIQRRQGLKAEKNLKFLLQKVLKQSDVGSLGRIVLPKKEAEMHLPELEARDGMSISMEDIVTSRVWNMRYRFWPNNKSRMYLLENTGDFVRTNELQEGDFIVIYSDIKCGKFLIRGVKVRHPEQKKTEVKKPARSRKNNQSALAQASGQSSKASKAA